MSKTETPPPTQPQTPLQSLADQMSTMERLALERVKTSMHEAARLCVEALDYGAALSARWRAFAIDALRRTSDTPAP